MVRPSNHTGPEKQGHPRGSEVARLTNGGDSDTREVVEDVIRRGDCPRCGAKRDTLARELAGKHNMGWYDFDLTLHKLRFCSECRAWAEREGILPGNLSPP